MFQDLIDDVNALCVDVLSDTASITDGSVTLSALAGFFRQTWDETTSNQYGFMADMPTFECQTDDLSTLDLSTVGSTLKLTFNGRVYVAMDQRADHGMTLLVLQR